MEDVVLYRAFEAFCRQRAQMVGESSAFWLKEAEVLAELIGSLGRSKVLGPTMDIEEQKSSLLWEPKFCGTSGPKIMRPMDLDFVGPGFPLEESGPEG
jgi:hypothetical protein